MSRRENLTNLARLWSVPLAVAVGFTLYLCAAILIVGQWRLMPPAMNRMVEIQRFLLKQAGGDSRPILLLGSSVLLEGVDAQELDAAAGGAASFNLAWTGATPRQWLLVLPAAVAARPGAIGLFVDLPSLAAAGAIPEARLNLAAWWDFLSESDRADLAAVLTSEERRVLDSSRVAQLLRFRSLPLGAFDSYVREVARPDLRYEEYATNFKDPWVRRQRVGPEALQRNIEQYETSLRHVAPEQRRTGIETLAAVIARARRGGAPVAVVLTPLHPELAARIGSDLLSATIASARSVSEAGGATFVDHSSFMPAGEFSDAVHPFEDGRRRWSAELGRVLSGIRAAGGG